MLQIDGGLLRLSPASLGGKTVDIEPQLDRLLLFWSDQRTPHEVLPAFRHRYVHQQIVLHGVYRI